VNGRPISGPEFGAMFREFRLSAFRLEWQEDALSAERDAFARFDAGSPLLPSALPWWQEWLDEVREMTGQGKHISRVRILSHAPTRYQQWGIWACPWHIQAGEDVRYLPHRKAADLGISTGNWWLFDDAHLVLMTFTVTGEIGRKALITDQETIDIYCRWRDLAVAHSASVEEIAVA